MKKIQLLAILGLISLTQVHAMDKPQSQQDIVAELQRLQMRKKPAAATDSSGATYYKPLPAVPVKKPAAVTPVIAAKPAAISSANQELINKLAENLTKLGEKITSLNDKIPSVVTNFKSGDLSQMVSVGNIKTTFWTAVRSGEAGILIAKVKKYVQELNQTDKSTQQAAKTRVTPILTSAAFTTATKNLEEYLGKLPEPFGSEAKSLIDVTRFLKAQFDIKNTANNAEGSEAAQEAR